MSNQQRKRNLTRREMMKRGLLGAAGAALIDPRALWAGAPAPELLVPAPAPAARAKAVIQIWMWGGPSQIDTFDPKPTAGYDYCGPFNKIIPTVVDDVHLNEHLKLLAKQADKFSIIRSMTHGINSHETASYRVQTGHMPGRLVYPCAGAVVSQFKGYAAGYQSQVPPYIVLTQPQGRFSEAGFLGPSHKPFATGGDPARTPFAVEGIVAQGITDQRQKLRRKLLHDLDSLGRVMPESEPFKRLDECEEKAYELMFGETRKLFDLAQEKKEMRDRYGRNTFGQSCLMARRLIEHGVPYVTINYRGWDTHKQHFEIMRRKLPEMDQGMAALIADLSECGLLDSTIIWWGGEFGRGPKVQWNPPWNGGRSHWGPCFSTVVAGGGFKGGRVVGASDDKGAYVAERPVYPEDLLGSIYTLLGIDPDGPLPNPRGLDLKVMPQTEKSGGHLKEIM